MDNDKITEHVFKAIEILAEPPPPKSYAASFTTHMLGVVSETIFTVVSAVPGGGAPSKAGDAMTPAEFAKLIKDMFAAGKMEAIITAAKLQGGNSNGVPALTKNIILACGDFISALGAATSSPELKAILQGDLIKDVADYFVPSTTTLEVCSKLSVAQNSSLSERAGHRATCESAGCTMSKFGMCYTTRIGEMYKGKKVQNVGMPVELLMDVFVKDLFSHMLPANAMPTT